ncbi:MAG: transposase, partial [Proteobacteria bacterium]|nr:transposase [Pseudomonadota bacterium]
AKVPKGHFGETREGILVVDRYSAYKAMVKYCVDIILAFCWAHVRRDFLGVAKDWPRQEEWAMEWVEAIGNLYHLNQKRLEVLDEPEKFAKRDVELRDAVDEMERKRELELAEENIHPARKKALVSKREHWDGLTVFVDHPEVPMDNNTAENHIRGPVGGRKTYYGSGAIWSGCLAAMLFSILQTLGLWNINTRLWLTDYLNACAANGGKAPDDIRDFLPWNMSPEQRKRLSLKIPINDSS